jgi:serine/threonine-protein kinase
LLPVERDESDPMIGQIIKNTFRVVRLLGEGGMGRVYEGEQQMGTKARKVAIKTLHPHLSQDPQIVARFNRECGTVAELEHPNTIQFFDFGQAPDGTLFIAMEFLEGTDVCQTIEREGPMPPARVANIMRQVCGSLAEAHKKGIIHRDLKPDNVVLTTRADVSDSVKLLDFGIAARTEATDAKREQKLTQQGMVLGTPPYMSPEQFTGKEIDARSDIYSLGVMAYEMLTGKLPFEAETPWEWATKHLTERPYPFEVTAPRTAMIPEPMKTAIMRSLSKNREERQPDVMAFYNELSATAPAAYAGGGVAATGTAAMAAPPPGFLQAAAPAAAYGPVPQQAGPAPTAAEMFVPVQAQFAPPPKKSGGGLKFALLGVVGLVLLVGVVGVVMVVRNIGGTTDDDNLSLGGLPSATGVTEIAPVASAGGPATPSGIDASAADAAKTATTATVVATRPPNTVEKPPPKKGPTGEEACKKSIQLARQQAIEAAVSLYNACRSGGGSSAGLAHSTIRSNAGRAAQSATYLHDCAAAKRIASAAGSIGADGGSGAIASSCK